MKDLLEKVHAHQFQGEDRPSDDEVAGARANRASVIDAVTDAFWKADGGAVYTRLLVAGAQVLSVEVDQMSRLVYARIAQRWANVMAERWEAAAKLGNNPAYDLPCSRILRRCRSSATSERSLRETLRARDRNIAVCEVPTPPPAQRRADKKSGLSPEFHAACIAGWMKGFLMSFLVGVAL